MLLGTTLKKIILQPFLCQQKLVSSQNKKCAALNIIPGISSRDYPLGNILPGISCDSGQQRGVYRNTEAIALLKYLCQEFYIFKISLFFGNFSMSILCTWELFDFSHVCSTHECYHKSHSTTKATMMVERKVMQYFH